MGAILDRRQRRHMDLDKDVSLKFAERTPHSLTTTQLRRGDATTATVRCRRTIENRSPTPTETRRKRGVAMGLTDPCCSRARTRCRMFIRRTSPLVAIVWAGMVDGNGSVDIAGRSSTGRLQPEYRRRKLRISSSTQ